MGRGGGGVKKYEISWGYGVHVSIAIGPPINNDCRRLIKKITEGPMCRMQIMEEKLVWYDTGRVCMDRKGRDTMRKDKVRQRHD